MQGVHGREKSIASFQFLLLQPWPCQGLCDSKQGKRGGGREREKAGAALTQRTAKYSLLLNWSCQRGGGDEITGFYIWKSSERQPSKAHPVSVPPPTGRYFAQDMAYPLHNQMKGQGIKARSAYGDLEPTFCMVPSWPHLGLQKGMSNTPARQGP